MILHGPYQHSNILTPPFSEPVLFAACHKNNCISIEFDGKQETWSIEWCYLKKTCFKPSLFKTEIQCTDKQNVQYK